MTAITGGELWVEGDADSKKEALAKAIMNASEIPLPAKGMKTIIQIDTVWQDDDGRCHAKIFFQQVPDPDAPQPDSDQETAIKLPHDDLTEPHGIGDDALHSTKKMEDAEEKIEDDFDGAVHQEKEDERTAAPEAENKAESNGKPSPLPDASEDEADEH